MQGGFDSGFDGRDFRLGNLAVHSVKSQPLRTPAEVDFLGQRKTALACWFLGAWIQMFHMLLQRAVQSIDEMSSTFSGLVRRGPLPPAASTRDQAFHSCASSLEVSRNLLQLVCQKIFACLFCGLRKRAESGYQATAQFVPTAFPVGRGGGRSRPPASKPFAERSRNWIPNQNGTGFWGGPAHVRSAALSLPGSHSLSLSTIESALPWNCGRRSPIVN